MYSHHMLASIEFIRNDNDRLRVTHTVRRVVVEMIELSYVQVRHASVVGRDLLPKLSPTWQNLEARFV